MKSNRLEGKRCLITGGSRGLGRQLCQAFAAEGASIAFTFLKNTADADQTQKMLESLGSPCLAFQGSVVDPTHAQQTVSEVVRAWGGLDILVNNAGTTQILPFVLIEEADWDYVMNVNVKGAYLFSREALRPMIRAKCGHILNIGAFSDGRVVTSPVHFAASKAALRGMTEAMALEFGRYGILVNLLAPGLLDVGLGQRVPPARAAEFVEESALGGMIKAVDVARTAVFLVSGQNSFITGAKVVVDGGV